jgi:hypothetical protein
MATGLHEEVASCKQVNFAVPVFFLLLSLVARSKVNDSNKKKYFQKSKN